MALSASDSVLQGFTGLTMDPPSSPFPPDHDLNALPEWHNLPSDCWKLIFTKHLPPRHYTIYRLVSKSWKQAIDELGLHTQSVTLHPAALNRTRLDTLPPAMVLQAHTAQVTCVPNLSHMNCILSTVQQMTRLRTLTFNALGALPSFEVFRQVHLPHVTSLTLQLDRDLRWIVSANSQKYHLMTEVELAQQLPIITGATPNLQSLHVDVVSNIEEKEPRLSRCPGWVVAMVAPVPGLTSLQIKNSPRYIRYDLSTLADVAPRLQTFVAVGSCITNADLLHLCRHPSLTTIEVMVSSHSADSGSPALAVNTPKKILCLLDCEPLWLPAVHELVEPYVSQMLVKRCSFDVGFPRDHAGNVRYCNSMCMIDDPRWQLDPRGAHIDVPRVSSALERMTNLLPQAAVQECIESLALEANMLTVPGLAALQGYRKLTKLVIVNKYKVDIGDVTVQQICTSLPGISHIGKYLTQLTSLTVRFGRSDDSPVPCQAWANGFRALPRTLRVLELRNCGHVVNTQVLEAIVQTCPFLEQLELNGAQPREEEWTPLFAKLHLLQNLRLSTKQRPVSDAQTAAWQQMVHALRHMPGLHELYFWPPVS